MCRMREVFSGQEIFKVRPQRGVRDMGEHPLCMEGQTCFRPKARRPKGAGGTALKAGQCSWSRVSKRESPTRAKHSGQREFMVLSGNLPPG